MIGSQKIEGRSKIWRVQLIDPLSLKSNLVMFQHRTKHSPSPKWFPVRQWQCGRPSGAWLEIEEGDLCGGSWAGARLKGTGCRVCLGSSRSSWPLPFSCDSSLSSTFLWIRKSKAELVGTWNKDACFWTMFLYISFFLNYRPLYLWQSSLSCSLLIGSCCLAIIPYWYDMTLFFNVTIWLYFFKIIRI